MVSGATTDTTYYMGSFEYKNGKLSQIFTDEGRVRYDEGSDAFIYYYYLKDHLGNIRIVFTDDGTGSAEALQVNNYYPFGMRFNQAPAIEKQDNDYLYNGKELQKFGLDWYDYGARFYDPALARWHSIDPKAEKYYPVSTYAYGGNNPIYFIDPNGMELKGYSLDDEGNIERIKGDNTGGNDYDVLFAVDDEGNKKDTNQDGEVNEADGQKVEDTSVLPELSEKKTSKEGYGIRYASTKNKDDAFNVFHYATNNSSVEWGLDGYQYPFAQQEYLLSTYQVDYTTPDGTDVGWDLAYESFSIHSHVLSNGSFGASDGDMDYIRNKAKSLAKRGINRVPLHYVYEKENSTLYNYTTKKSNIYIRKINKVNDFFFGNF